MEDVGWHFPPTKGGREDGYVDPGMEYFRGSPLACLARETIQNSLDARSAMDSPVAVVFEVKATSPANDLGRDELRRHIEACLHEHELTNNPKAQQEFARAADLLSNNNIAFLRIADYNTTGLDQRHWEALVKRQGSSEKSSRSAGGSFGIGKYAPFVVSQLRTVFYWSRYETAKLALECCQGKSVLLSHESPDGKTQGTGFFGHRDGCRQLQGRQIPHSISAVERTRDASGTSLWIAGFADHADWRIRVAQSVVSNFFCAIADGQLEVLIEPEDTGSVFEHWDIKRGNLATTFEGLLAHGNRNQDPDLTRLKEAFAFYTAMYSDKGILKEREDVDLGHCRLWIHVEDDLPSKVGLIRKTGMLITAEQRGLLRFPGLQDFAAVLRFESDRGNELLRDMENPQHSQFEPDRLSPDEQARGRRALNRIIKWIREEIKALATLVVADRSEEVSELAHLLPDIEPDESFGERDDGEQGFGGSDTVALKPARRLRNATLDEEGGDDAGDDMESDEGSSASVEDGGGGGGGGGSGGGGGAITDGGTTGGGRARQAVPLRDVRLLPSSQSHTRRSFRIAFTPTESAKDARIEVAEAGDSTAITRNDLTIATDTGEVPLADHSVQLEANRRVSFEVLASEPIDGRSWRVQAKTAQRSTDGDAS